MSNPHEDRSDLHIAVVGMAARFAGADDPDTYWRNIRDGVESITEFTVEELRERGVPETLLRDPNYVRRAPVLNDMEGFDAAFFGFNPKEGAILDPQHRHFLECAWEALEHAGHPPEGFDGPIGVYGGNGMQAYMMYNLISNPSLMGNEGLFLVRHTGNDKDFLATRVSYELDLTGPGITVQTACSTSLVAIHMAVQALLNGEVDMALAGGVTIELPHRVGYLYKHGEILSPDGSCRSFDASSVGTIFGSGCGIVVLRRLSDAIADGDTIHSVLLSSAINNDGHGKVGFLAPSVDGQAKCVIEAIELAGVEPDTITYVECHGTGTPVGDPIEVTALTQAFRTRTDAIGFCGVGSVKPNVGHTDTAAGIAGAIKVVQALKHGQLPPSLFCDTPTPAIPWDTTPFYVNTELREWTTGGFPRRAGVSSLGVGGTNSHIILEEPPPPGETEPSPRDRHLIVVSAKTGSALDRSCERLADHLEANPDLDLADVAWTLQVGRTGLPERRAFVCGADDAAATLADLDGATTATAATGERSLAFMFAGGGAQYPNMGRDLYESEPVYRETVDECLDLLRDEIDFDLAALLFPDRGAKKAAAKELERPSRTLPALFTTQYAQAQLWMSWGVEPDALIGHSMGEYTAACLSGVFTLADALATVALRGRLFERVRPGGMLSVALDVEELEPLLGKSLDIAAVNAPGMALASGPKRAITALEKKLAARDIDVTRVRIDIAAHSSMLDGILDEFRAHLGDVRFGEAEIPFVSNLSGDWADPDEVVTGDYWVRHLRETVLFADGVRTLLEDSTRVLVEVGPGRTLATLAKMSDARRDRHVVAQSLRHPQERVSDLDYMLRVLGSLWTAGVEIDWGLLHDDARRRRLPLPTYPWEHQHLWIEPGEHAYRGEGSVVHGPARRSDPTDWFYLGSWTTRLSGPLREDERPVLILSDGSALAGAIANAVEDTDRLPVTVLRGSRYARRDDRTYEVHEAAGEDFAKLFKDLDRNQRTPGAIVHLWSQRRSDDALAEHGPGRQSAFDSLFALARALGEAPSIDDLKLLVVVAGTGVAGDDADNPLAALAVGPVTVIPAELNNVSASLVDIATVPAGSAAERALAHRIFVETDVIDGEPLVAVRGSARLVHTWVAAPVPAVDPSRVRIVEGGAYVITGGLGGLGLTAAERLTALGARVALISRSGLPPRDEWKEYVRTHDARDPVRVRIERVGALEASGSRVLVLQADVADLDALIAAVDEARLELGPIRGVLHTAGVLDDDLFLLKTLDRAHAVLQPKVLGTLNVDRATARDPLDFFLLYSSVSAILGMPGQIDYAAANAFLNAFARHRVARDGVPTVAIGWPAWQDVGMAATLAQTSRTFERGGGRAVGHPLLGRCVVESPHRASYVTRISIDTHWIASEHRIHGGAALLPGAAYLELARAAISDGSEPGPVEVRDIFFASPFAVPDAGARSLRVDLRRQDDFSEFVVTSGGPDLDAEEHVRGTVQLTTAVDHPEVDVAAVRKRCKRSRETFPKGPKPDPNMDFGPRWGNLRSVAYGDGEALATLELPAEFVDDLELMRLHPAVLDLSTAGAQRLVPGFDADRDFFVPIGYSHLYFCGELPAKVLSHVRYRSTGDPDLAVFDATICDRRGRVIAEVGEFTMRRIATRSALIVATPDPTGSHETAGRRRTPDPLAVSLERGVSPAEGLDVLERVLAADLPPEVVVAPHDFHAILDEARARHARPTVVEEVSVEIDGDEDFVAPRTDAERTIAAIWRDALGVRRVAADSDFFDLGGHSLVAIRITSRLTQAFGIDLPLRTIFESPTVAALAAHIEAESGVSVPDGAQPDPREPTGSHAAIDIGTEPIEPLGPYDERVPSFAQEGLWFIDQMQPDNSAFNIPVGLRLRGTLDVAVLEGALTEVSRRHESMRTTFADAGGLPRPEVTAPGPVAVQLHDVAVGRSADDAAQEFANAAAAAPFDLARGPLFRADLGRLDDDDHVLVLTMHHIVSDEWSLELLYEELAAAYTALLDDPEATSPLPEQPVQYGDFAAWHRSRFDEERLATGLKWWKEALGGAQMTLQVPTDRPRPPIQTQRGARAYHVFSPAVAEAFRKLAQRQGVTMFVGLLAAFQTLLYRLTGQEDLLVASPSSTRTRIEAENLIGFFVNTLVLRGDLSGNPSFVDVIARTRAMAMDAFEHADLPFDVLVRELDIDRDPSRNPIYQVMFALFPSSRDITLPSLEVETLDVDAGGAQVDLTLYVSDSADELKGIFEYNADLFDEETIARLAVHFETLLRHIVAEPERPVGELPMLGDEARRRILHDWNVTEADYPREACVHNLFEAWRKRAPDRIAVEAAGETLTYRELDVRANQVAGHLRRLGVKPGDFVGVCTRRTTGMAVALLGVMKAGGAYLPLDPDFPPERLAFMLADSEAPVLITESVLADRLPAHRAQLVLIDDDWPEIAKRAPRKPKESSTPAGLAYVIYTSGSTGCPKGVVVPHRAVVNFLTSMAETPGLEANDTLVAVTTISFDISVLEIFGPLTVGGRLVLADKDVASDGRALAALIDASGATVMQATPATWRLLFQAGWGSSDIRALCGGEAMPRDLARELVANTACVWNMYGPTETTIWSAVFELTDPDGPILIGRPIANTQCFVLDTHMRLVPVGVPGLLWIGGDGVTNGYLGRAELTEERFVPLPEHLRNGRASEGARLYDTGDLVRYRASGDLEYLHRVDNQVKVRGYRIELGEIEAAIVEQPGVRRAVAVAHEFGPGDTRLVAWVVPKNQRDVDVATVRKALRERLPEYMVPSMWHTLDALPLTANGKVDRKALPVPGGRRDDDFAPPETPAEIFLADLWCDRLQIDSIGVHDNFFDLGGHSLLAMTVIHAIETRAGHRFNPLELSMQTLGQLAAAIRLPGAEPEEELDHRYAEAMRDAENARRPNESGPLIKKALDRLKKGLFR